MSIIETKRKKRRKEKEEGENIQYISLSIEGREVEERQKFQY
jgi:hypothetical protein